MKTHEVKSWPEYYALVITGIKNFELRKNDREYQLGDMMVLQEFRPGVGEYTGREQRVLITYMVTNKDTVGMDGLKDGYCIIGFERLL